MKPELNKTRTCKAFFFDWNAADCPDYGEPGASSKLYDTLLCFTCPGCGRFGSIPCSHPKEPKTWDITGGSLDDVTSLTLSPSIHCVGCCGWHGFLTNGEFKSC